jgi:FHA domain
MATCPAGHDSATDDYCDTCGAPLAVASTGSPLSPEPAAASTPGTAPTPGDGRPSGRAADPEAAGDAGAGAASGPTSEGAAEATGAGGTAGMAASAGEASAAGGVACPGCGDTVVGRFCESCGYDIESGQAPKRAAVTLTLSADRGHWDRMVGSGEPAFPPAVPAITFELTGDRATLGRVTTGAAPDVDLALSGAAADPAVSHHQCEFERQGGGGTWTVQDSGSSNGTWINDADEPLPAGQIHTLTEGDRIFVGAWTCLTVHLPPPTAST